MLTTYLCENMSILKLSTPALDSNFTSVVTGTFCFFPGDRTKNQSDSNQNSELQIFRQQKELDRDQVRKIMSLPIYVTSFSSISYRSNSELVSKIN